jgi:hypothetical protein
MGVVGQNSEPNAAQQKFRILSSVDSQTGLAQVACPT